jgi:molybdopterin-binding protein
MGIEHLAGADIRTLSGGELQRVALARALALQPEILFLDEPTSSLDVHVSRRFREDVRRVVEHLAATVVIITHDHNEALALAQRVAVINAGRVVQVGTPEEVFTHPQDAFVAGFTGAETIWHGEVTGTHDGLCTVRTGAGLSVQVVAGAEVGQRVVLAIRPENVAVEVEAPVPGAAACALPGGTHSSVRNAWRGVVIAASPVGPLARLVVRLDCEGNVSPVFGGEGEVISLITRASAEELGLTSGATVRVSVKATAIHVLESGQ